MASLAHNHKIPMRFIAAWIVHSARSFVHDNAELSSVPVWLFITGQKRGTVQLKFNTPPCFAA
jgi:hypothetical protein